MTLIPGKNTNRRTIQKWLAITAISLSAAACGTGAGPTTDETPDPIPTPDPAPNLPSTPDPVPTPPPTLTPADNRNIVLDGSTGAFDLSTPSKAAAIARGFLTALSSANAQNGGLLAKAAESCGGGGTKNSAVAGSVITTLYAECIENDVKKDGALQASTGAGADLTQIESLLVFGTTDVPYLTEVLSPEASRSRTLLRGGLAVASTFAGGFDPVSSHTELELQGAYVALAAANTPRADFKLGNGENDPFVIDSQITNNRVASSTYAGRYQSLSACGAGSGVISTPTRLSFDGSGNLTGGQVVITASNSTATVAVSANGVTISAGGTQQAFGFAELAALCPG